MGAEGKIAFADIGNSRIKIYDGSNYLSLTYNANLIKELNEVFKINSIYRVYYSSVNFGFEEMFRSKFETLLEIINISSLVEEQQIIDFSNVTGMGIDRKLSLFGGLSITAPPLISIDCGTAITINVLDKDRICTGGIIFPGFKLQERSLREMTSGLKNFELKQPAMKIGKTTSEAISSGIILGIANSIITFVNSIKKDSFHEEDLNIFLTGGSAVLILQLLKNQFHFQYENKLNLLGMMYLINNRI